MIGIQPSVRTITKGKIKEQQLHIGWCVTEKLDVALHDASQNDITTALGKGAKHTDYHRQNEAGQLYGHPDARQDFALLHWLIHPDEVPSWIVFGKLPEKFS